VLFVVVAGEAQGLVVDRDVVVARCHVAPDVAGDVDRDGHHPARLRVEVLEVGAPSLEGDVDVEGCPHELRSNPEPHHGSHDQQEDAEPEDEQADGALH
jgi:hypothetical protein